jgi:SAM-dependent methyltransferase
MMDWKDVWEKKARRGVSDFEFDRGRPQRAQDLESLAVEELLAFVRPKAAETVFDAGCGSGVNILLLNRRVNRIIGMDYAAAAMTRCQKRIVENGLSNVALLQGTITEIAVGAGSIDKILCLSVLQYLSDAEVKIAIREFARILKPGGEVIFHVKNSSSVYLATLMLGKKAKQLLGRRVTCEYFRRFGWYVRELEAAGFCVADYNSFNLAVIEGMPRVLVDALQRLELRYYRSIGVRRTLLRRMGSELKIRALLRRPI